MAAALVLAVAALAAAGSRRSIFAVKMRSPGDICADALVTSHAFRILRVLAEGSVATVAAALELGVSGSKGTRRNQSFYDRLRRSRRRKQRANQQDQM